MQKDIKTQTLINDIICLGNATDLTMGGGSMVSEGRYRFDAKIDF